MALVVMQMRCKMHCWKIVEQTNGGEGLTDLELIQLYTLVSHGSADYYRIIAKKLERVVSLAKHNMHSLHTWEDEGGTCNGSQASHNQQNHELPSLHGFTPASG